MKSFQWMINCQSGDGNHSGPKKRQTLCAFMLHANFFVGERGEGEDAEFYDINCLHSFTSIDNYCT
uniref:Uncharacterized protein n=1 Tax=Rhizophora mucronata TaxID=61149 RepID=A0A2P2N909_RHIMU